MLRLFGLMSLVQVSLWLDDLDEISQKLNKDGRIDLC